MPVSKNRRRKNKGAAPPKTATAAAEGTSKDAYSESEENVLWRAQNIIYDAWEAETRDRRITLAKQALKVSDLCADAHVLLAEEEAETTAEARAHYERGVAAGERALGPEGFKDAGDFWGILETRPYMRARAGLAVCLWELGERAAAIDHCQALLRLNPEDNQGMRHILAGWLLAIDDHDSLEELFDAYEDDAFAVWAYAEALLAFRKGESDQARDALAAAWEVNPHVPAMLTGAAQVPEHQPDSYAWGSREEAIIYVQQHGELWSTTPGATTWLAETVETFPPPDVT